MAMASWGEDVLARMVQDGVLVASQTRQKALTYSPGRMQGSTVKPLLPCDLP